jgi:hypothetical protein
MEKNWWLKFHLNYVRALKTKLEGVTILDVGSDIYPPFLNLAHRADETKFHRTPAFI